MRDRSNAAFHEWTHDACRLASDWRDAVGKTRCGCASYSPIAPMTVSSGDAIFQMNA